MRLFNNQIRSSYDSIMPLRNCTTNEEIEGFPKLARDFRYLNGS